MTDTAAPPAPVSPPIPIPSFHSADGTLRELRPKDFPKTREGRQALCRYKAEVYRAIAKQWEDKANDIDKADDPLYQKQRKAEKLRAQLARLEAELDNKA